MRRRAAGRIYLSVIAAVVLIAVVALVALAATRHRIASAAAKAGLEDNHLACAPVRAHAPLAIVPDRVRLDPMRCESDRGPMRLVRFRSPVIVEMDGFDPRAIRSHRADLVLRPRDTEAADTNTLGDLLDVTGVADPLIALLLDASDLAAFDAPALLIDRLRLFRGRQHVADLRAFRLRHDGRAVVLTGGPVTMQAVAGVEVDTLVARATRERATARVTAHGLAAVMEGSRLASPRPRFEFRVDTD